jgi:hypothetical protein
MTVAFSGSQLSQPQRLPGVIQDHRAHHQDA